MYGIFVTTGELLFPLGRLTKVVKLGRGVVNSTNPLLITKNITLTVIDCCTPPPVRLAAHCIAAGATIGASIISPNPLTIGSSIHLVSEIFENC